MLPAIVMLEPEIDLHEGPPLRPFWLPNQMHSGLMRGPVGLDRITADTRADNVFPRGRSAPVARDDMVQIQVFAIKVVTTILAGVLVSLEDIVPRKLHFLLRQAIEQHQQNHSRDPNSKGDRVDALWMRFLLRKIVPLVKVEGLKGAIAVIHHHLGAAFE